MKMWLCTFMVQVDLSSDLAVNEMEGLVAFGINKSLVERGIPGNVSVQLVATAGNASVADPTRQLEPVLTLDGNGNPSILTVAPGKVPPPGVGGVPRTPPKVIPS